MNEEANRVLKGSPTIFYQKVIMYDNGDNEYNLVKIGFVDERCGSIVLIPKSEAIKMARELLRGVLDQL